MCTTPILISWCIHNTVITVIAIYNIFGIVSWRFDIFNTFQYFQLLSQYFDEVFISLYFQREINVYLEWKFSDGRNFYRADYRISNVRGHFFHIEVFLGHLSFKQTWKLLSYGTKSNCHSEGLAHFRTYALSFMECVV